MGSAMMQVIGSEEINMFAKETVIVIGNEEMNMVAKETNISMGLVFMMEKWFKGQVMMLPEESQERWMEMHGGKKGKHDDHDDHDDHEDMEFSPRAFYGF